MKIAIRVLVVVLAASCTKATEAAPSPQSTSPPAASAAELVPPAFVPPPLADARLRGKWNVQLFVRSSSFASHPRRIQKDWRFQPLCKSGACDVILRGRVFFQPDKDRQTAGAGNLFRVRLIQLGTTYGGNVTDFFASCGAKAEKDTWTFALKVTDAAMIGSVWSATGWSGTWSRAATFPSLCTPSHLQAVVRGKLARP